MRIYLGVDKNNELIYLEWDKVDNEQRQTFSLSGGSYSDPKTEEQGEQEARDILSNWDYWEDIGYLGKDNTFFKNYIDFKRLAEDTINIDGWENVNGEYSHFGEYNNKEIYLNSSSGGQHKVNIEDFKELWISKEDLKQVYNLWDKQHLKPLKEEYKIIMLEFFNKYKSLCSDEDVLIKYLKAIKWEQ